MTSFDSPLSPGDMLRGRYRIVSRLGRGGFGVTYRAVDVDLLDSACVVKLLHPLHGMTPKAQEMFEREARTLKAIRHPLVPRLQAYFEERGDFFLVEDYVRGAAWSTLVEEHGPVAADTALAVADDVLDALEYLHAQRSPIVHRDIKLGNLIRRDDDGRTALIDFGAVREVVDGTADGGGGTIIYSRGYSPSEQFTGRAVPASDLHALGATVLALVTGCSPDGWWDAPTGRLDVRSRFDASSEVQDFVARLVAPLGERLATAAEARALLRTVRGHPPADVATLATPAPRRAAVTERRDRDATPAPPRNLLLVDAVHDGPAAGIRGHGRRQPAIWIATALVAIAAGGVALARAGRDAPTPSAPTPSAPPPDAGRPAPNAPGPAPAPNTSPRVPDATAAARRMTVTTEAGIPLTAMPGTAWVADPPRDRQVLALRHATDDLRFLAGVETTAVPTAAPATFASRWVARFRTRLPVAVVPDAAERAGVGEWDVPLRLRAAPSEIAGVLRISRFERDGQAIVRWWAAIGAAGTFEADSADVRALVTSIRLGDPRWRETR